MASISKFDASAYSWDGGYEATAQSTSRFCNDIESCGGWVSAGSAEGKHGTNDYVYPVITVGNDYVIKLYGSGAVDVFKNGEKVGGTFGMNGNYSEFVVVYDSWFVHFLMHGGYSGVQNGASIAIGIFNIEGKHIVGSRVHDNYSNRFNSINEMSFIDESGNKYGFGKIFNYEADPVSIDVNYQPFAGITESGFVACPALPISEAYDHKIIKFQNQEYYALGTNTLVRVKRS